jgi:hypothetical protein
MSLNKKENKTTKGFNSPYAEKTMLGLLEFSTLINEIGFVTSCLNLEKLRLYIFVDADNWEAKE